jgi:hypothetical protein
MGYTHYWTQQRDFSDQEWTDACQHIEAITGRAQANGVRLAKEYDEPDAKPFFGPDHLQFNGVGENGHETFWITRVMGREPRYQGDNPAWAFCKTAYKPYDIVVTAALCYLATVAKTHAVTSDGEPDEWQPGLALAQTALPQFATVLDVPAGVKESA